MSPRTTHEAMYWAIAARLSVAAALLMMACAQPHVRTVADSREGILYALPAVELELRIETRTITETLTPIGLACKKETLPIGCTVPECGSSVHLSRIDLATIARPDPDASFSLEDAHSASLHVVIGPTGILGDADGRASDPHLLDRVSFETPNRVSRPWQTTPVCRSKTRGLANEARGYAATVSALHDRRMLLVTGQSAGNNLPADTLEAMLSRIDHEIRRFESLFIEREEMLETRTVRVSSDALRSLEHDGAVEMHLACVRDSTGSQPMAHIFLKVSHGPRSRAPSGKDLPLRNGDRTAGLVYRVPEEVDVTLVERPFVADESPDVTAECEPTPLTPSGAEPVQERILTSSRIIVPQLGVLRAIPLGASAPRGGLTFDPRTGALLEIGAPAQGVTTQANGIR